MAFIEASDQFRRRHHCQTFETFLTYRKAANAERDRIMFQIVVSELDRDGNVVRCRPTQPLYEVRETAMAMAEFDKRCVCRKSAALMNQTIASEL